MLKLKLQYFGHLMQRADSFEKTLILGNIEGRRRRGQQRMRWLDGITDSMDMGLGALGSWWWTGSPGVLQFMGSQRVGHDGATELDWLSSALWREWISVVPGTRLGFTFKILKFNVLPTNTCFKNSFSLRIKAQYQTVDEPSGKILFDFLSQKILFSSFRAPN